PSETETQGLVLAEAHACGLAAVAVRASGVEEVVVDGETGLLTKPDARDLADAAIGLLLDPVRRAAMGAAGGGGAREGARGAGSSSSGTSRRRDKSTRWWRATPRSGDERGPRGAPDVPAGLGSRSGGSGARRPPRPGSQGAHAPEGARVLSGGAPPAPGPPP